MQIDRCNSNKLLIADGPAIGEITNENYNLLAGNSGNVGESYLNGVGAAARMGIVTGLYQMRNSCNKWLFVDSRNHCIRSLDTATKRVTGFTGLCSKWSTRNSTRIESETFVAYFQPNSIIEHELKYGHVLISEYAQIREFKLSEKVAHPIYTDSAEVYFGGMIWSAGQLFVTSNRGLHRLTFMSNGNQLVVIGKVVHSFDVNPWFSVDSHIGSQTVPDNVFQRKEAILKLDDDTFIIAGGVQRNFMMVDVARSSVAELESFCFDMTLDLYCPVIVQPVTAMAYDKEKSTLFIGSQNDGHKIAAYNGKSSKLTFLMIPFYIRATVNVAKQYASG